MNQNIKKNGKILVSGASIAGPALAFWLDKFEFDVSVVERAAELRLGGQNVDVKGAGREVARRMGIEEAIRAANTGEKGVRFVDENNETKAEFAKGEAGGLTQELEILRGDLARILYDLTKENVAYQFGDYVTNLNDRGDAVEFTFNSGKTEEYDLVIAADGLNSKTRSLIFGDEPEIKFLGLYTAYFTIPRQATDTDWARWYNAPDPRVILLRPDNEGTTRASFNFLSDDESYKKLAPAEQKKLLKEKLAGAGWESERLIAALDETDDVYFDQVSQVNAPRWSSGRMAITGDAAYCPSPVTGMGTTLALTGAYVLAGELARHESHEKAFAAYEKEMRPTVEEAQSLPPGVPWIVYPETRLGVSIFNSVVGIASSDAVGKIIEFFSGGKKDKDEEGELFDYEKELAK